MKKPANTTYPILESIKERWSGRSFSTQQLTVEELETIMEAARWAPSCNNEQNWRFVYAMKKDEVAFENLRGLLQGGNNAWAPDASVLIVSLARKTFAATGKDNFHYLHDVGLATQNLLLQAASMGMYGHPMAGFDREAAGKLFDLPEDEVAVCMIAIGYPGEPTALKEPFAEREMAARNRKPLDEVMTPFAAL